MPTPISKPTSTALMPAGSRTWLTDQPLLTAISFSFMTAAPSYGGTEGGTAFQPATDAMKQAVRDVFQRLSSELGMGFEEVSDSATSYGQIRVGVLQLSSAKGQAYVPADVPKGDPRAGDVYLDVESLAALAPGQEGWQALLHEIGHALGLRHPSATAAVNAPLYTVMSEQSAGNGLSQSWFGPADLIALRAAYGEPARIAVVRDSVYALTDAHGQALQAVYDYDAGVDTLDASAVTVGALLDLRPGGLSSVGLTAGGVYAVDNLVLDWNAAIEQVVGTRGDDLIYGNAWSNRITPGIGNDRILGDAGLDTVVLAGRPQDYLVSSGFQAGVYFVSPVEGGALDKSGVKTLEGVERVSFTGGGGLAFDVSQTAGQAYRIYKAAFNRTPDAEGLGYWIGQMDKGMGLQEVSARFIDSKEFKTLYGDAPSKADFLTKVYTNVLGRAPDKGGYDWWLNAMNTDPSKTFSKVLADFSESAENLSGTAPLVATGIVYEPWSG